MKTMTTMFLIEPRAGGVWVHAPRVVDRRAAWRLGELLRGLVRDGPRDVVVSLDGTSHVFYGLAASLNRAAARYRRAGSSLTVRDGSRYVINVLRAGGLDEDRVATWAVAV